jgi:cell division protein ZapA
MNHVNVTINGRQYRMACEEGQEARLVRLAESLEAKVESLRGKFGEIGDQRLTVMAALTACDELLDANARLEKLEQELASLRDVGVAGRGRKCAQCGGGAHREDHPGAEPHGGRGRGDRVRAPRDAVWT